MHPCFGKWWAQPPQNIYIYNKMAIFAAGGVIGRPSFSVVGHIFGGCKVFFGVCSCLGSRSFKNKRPQVFKKDTPAKKNAGIWRLRRYWNQKWVWDGRIAQVSLRLHQQGLADVEKFRGFHNSELMAWWRAQPSGSLAL